MVMALFFVCFFSISFNSFSQETLLNDTTYNSSILVTIEIEDTVVSQAELDKGFAILAKDSSYRIISFALTYPCKVDEKFALQQIVFSGQRVIIDPKYPKLWNVTCSDFITFERILVERNKRFYYAKPFIVYIAK